MKVCYQNKRMTNHKQNCLQSEKKKERKIKEETQKKVLDVFHKPIIDDLCSKIITHKHLLGL